MSAIQQLITEHMDIWTAADTGKRSGRGRASSNAVSVYGVKKLRELILGLAISGKLLHQNKIDISTQEVAKKLSLNRKVLNEDLLTEFQLPNTWQWFCISDLCDLKTGATPSTSVSAYYGGDIRWLVSGDIHGNEIYDCEGRITDSGLSNSNCKILPKNSILIALNGQGKTRATVAMLRCEAACNQSLVAMISKYNELILPEFIWLNLKYRYTEIRDITGQNQRRGLNMGLIGDLSVSVPPLAEQHNIITKVDELMALCDQLEAQHSNAAEAHEKLVSHLLGTLTQSQTAEDFSANWQRITAHFDTLFTTETSIDTLKQTLLQLAVMGKLVTQDPNDEPASELLKRIQAEKAKLVADGKIKKETPLASIGDDEKPFELPKRWEWARLELLANLITKGSSPKWQGVNYTDNTNDVLFVTSENVGSYSLLLDSPKFVETKFNEIEPRSILQKGDYLMNIVGASIGRTATFDRDDVANINQAVCLIRIENQALSKSYLLHFFNSQTCLEYMFDKQVDNARPNLSMGNIAKFLIPIAPQAEQHRIVAKVDELMALCDHLKTRIQQANQQQQAIANALVAQAVV